MRAYRGYVPTIEYSADDHEFVGTVEGIRDVIHFSGSTVDELEAAFHHMVDQYLAWCAEDGVDPDRPYSGKLAFRTTPEHHRLISEAAAARGNSINQWMDDVLTRAAEDTLADNIRKVRVR